jgi:hypothetical protein
MLLRALGERILKCVDVVLKGVDVVAPIVALAVIRLAGLPLPSRLVEPLLALRLAL